MFKHINILKKKSRLVAAWIKAETGVGLYLIMLNICINLLKRNGIDIFTINNGLYLYLKINS